MNSWQLIIVNFSVNDLQISLSSRKKLFGPAHVHGHVPVIFSIQEAESWDVANLELPGYVCYVSNFGFATLLVSDQFCRISKIMEV